MRHLVQQAFAEDYNSISRRWRCQPVSLFSTSTSLNLSTYRQTKLQILACTYIIHVNDSWTMSGWVNNGQNLADCFRLYQLTRRCKSKRDFGDGGRKEKGLPWALQRIMGAVVYKKNCNKLFTTQPVFVLCQNCFSYIFGLWSLLLFVKCFDTFRWCSGAFSWTYTIICNTLPKLGAYFLSRYFLFCGGGVCMCWGGFFCTSLNYQ